MRASLILFAAVFAGCTAVVLQRPAGHIIAREVHVATAAYWAPSEEELAPFERGLSEMFANPPRRIRQSNRFPLSEYVVSYFGDVSDGKRVIVAEGQHISQKSLAALKEENDRPDRIIRTTFGGGHLYFTAIYDTGTKTIENFSFNASK